MDAKFEKWLEKSACQTEMGKEGEQRTHPI